MIFCDVLSSVMCNLLYCPVFCDVLPSMMNLDPTAGPNVEAALSTSPSQAASQAEPRKAIIGAKKTSAVKKGVSSSKCLVYVKQMFFFPLTLVKISA